MAFYPSVVCIEGVFFPWSRQAEQRTTKQCLCTNKATYYTVLYCTVQLLYHPVSVFFFAIASGFSHRDRFCLESFFLFIFSSTGKEGWVFHGT